VWPVGWWAGGAGGVLEYTGFLDDLPTDMRQNRMKSESMKKKMYNCNPNFNSYLNRKLTLVTDLVYVLHVVIFALVNNCCKTRLDFT